MSSWSRLLKTLASQGSRMDSPEYQEQDRQDDMDPRNLQMIDREMQRSRSPAAQSALSAEKQRLEQVQKQRLLQAAQTFPQRLSQQLQPPPIQQPQIDPRVLMNAMMRVRAGGATGGWQPQIPGVTGAPRVSPDPTQGTPPAMAGIRG